jgi:hypothetical protein
MEGWNAETVGEVVRRSILGDDRVLSVLWNLDPSDTEAFHRITHGQISTVKTAHREQHHAGTLSDDDWKALKSSMKRYPRLDGVLEAMEEQRADGYDPGRRQKMVNGETVINVLAYRPIDNANIDTDFAETVWNAYKEWINKSTGVSDSAENCASCQGT